MSARPLLLLLLPLLPAAAVAQTSYNRWDARPPDPVVPLPRKTAPSSSPKPVRPASVPFDSVALTTGGYVRVETRPSFLGGTQAMLMVLQRNLKRPAGPRQRGSVLVRFTVLASGAMAGISVVPERSLSPAYNAAAVAAVEKLHTFIPGQRGGQPVDMVVTVPVEFR